MTKQKEAWMRAARRSLVRGERGTAGIAGMKSGPELSYEGVSS